MQALVELNQGVGWAGPLSGGHREDSAFMITQVIEKIQFLEIVGMRLLSFFKQTNIGIKLETLSFKCPISLLLPAK